MRKESMRRCVDGDFSETQKNVRKTRSLKKISKKHKTKEFGQLK